MNGEPERSVLSAVMFSPRGGSAHVMRALASELPRAGWRVTLVSGSRSDADLGDAEVFYEGLAPFAVDFAPALRSSDPLAFEGDGRSGPIHPSFEDRLGAPDRAFSTLDDDAFERQVRSWAKALERAGAARHDVLHLNHLTPVNEAAGRVAPGVPVVGQLHGTELLMLEEIEAGARASWEHADAWRARLRDWAHRCERLLVAPGGVKRARALLEVDESRLVPTPNGVDLARFHPREIDRHAHWRRHLADDPRNGAAFGGSPATDADLERLADGVVVIYVGRFTAVKRVPMLIEAFARAQKSFRRPTSLVLVGGHPGEWEGEHPEEAVRRTGARHVHLAGWRTHSELADFYNAADLIVLASLHEQFGQVLIEAMACGLPALATRSVGPEAIVADGETGWLVARDDPEVLSAALAEAVNDDAERWRRGEAAAVAVAESYGWDRVATGVAAAFEEALGARSSARSRRQ